MKDIIPYKSREVKHCPPHFIKVPVQVKKEASLFAAAAVSSSEENSIQTIIRDWLHENCEHRFYIGTHMDTIAGFAVESFVVSFENPADATYFTLLLPKFTENK